MKTHHSRAGAVIAVLAIASGACAYALNPPRVVRGTEIAPDKLALLAEGLSPGEVESVLGVPTEKRQHGRDVTWVYQWTYRHRGDTVRLLGLLPIAHPDRDRHQVTIEFDAAGLARAVLDDHFAGRASSRRILIPHKPPNHRLQPAASTVSALKHQVPGLSRGR
jgi:outer membrane protein assembly factor BamE (lipoprotein component of BamABCDE complex)